MDRQRRRSGFENRESFDGRPSQTARGKNVSRNIDLEEAGLNLRFLKN